MSRIRAEDCVVELELSVDHPTAWLNWHGLPIAHAHLEIEGHSARLTDIVVRDSLPHRNPFLRALGFRVKFRGRGAGSLLLNTVCTRLAAAGVRTVEGTMKGDIPRLTRWYGRIGFEVDRTTNQVKRVL